MTLQCNTLIENLTTYTENIYQYIEELYGNFDLKTQETWQRQLTETFIQYPDSEITDLEENLTQKGFTEPNSQTRALTAYWLLRCYTQREQDYPELVGENLRVLQNAMWTPFNNLPPTVIKSLDLQNNKLNIDGTNISIHMQTLGRIQVLNYLITHYREVKDFFEHFSADDKKDFALLKALDEQWITRQMNAFQEIAKSPKSKYRKNYWEDRSQINWSKRTTHQPPVEPQQTKYLSLLLTYVLPPLMGLGIAYPVWMLISPLSPFALTLAAVTSITIAATITAAWGIQRFIAPAPRPPVVPRAAPAEVLGCASRVGTQTAPRVIPSEERFTISPVIPAYSHHIRNRIYPEPTQAQRRFNRLRTRHNV